MLSKELYRTYVQILKDELVPAMGCTEPIAIAYAGAVARKTLGALPERVEVAVSRNIIKNVKSVVVPHTGGRRSCRNRGRRCCEGTGGHLPCGTGRHRSNGNLPEEGSVQCL